MSRLKTAKRALAGALALALALAAEPAPAFALRNIQTQEAGAEEILRRELQTIAPVPAWDNLPDSWIFSIGKENPKQAMRDYKKRVDSAKQMAGELRALSERSQAAALLRDRGKVRELLLKHVMLDERSDRGKDLVSRALDRLQEFQFASPRDLEDAGRQGPVLYDLLYRLSPPTYIERPISPDQFKTADDEQVRRAWEWVGRFEELLKDYPVSRLKTWKWIDKSLLEPLRDLEDTALSGARQLTQEAIFQRFFLEGGAPPAAVEGNEAAPVPARQMPAAAAGSWVRKGAAALAAAVLIGATAAFFLPGWRSAGPEVPLPPPPQPAQVKVEVAQPSTPAAPQAAVKPVSEEAQAQAASKPGETAQQTAPAPVAKPGGAAGGGPSARVKPGPAAVTAGRAETRPAQEGFTLFETPAFLSRHLENLARYIPRGGQAPRFSNGPVEWQGAYKEKAGSVYWAQMDFAPRQPAAFELGGKFYRVNGDSEGKTWVRIEWDARGTPTVMRWQPSDPDPGRGWWRAVEDIRHTDVQHFWNNVGDLQGLDRYLRKISQSPKRLAGLPRWEGEGDAQVEVAAAGLTYSSGESRVRILVTKGTLKFESGGYEHTVPAGQAFDAVVNPGGAVGGFQIPEGQSWSSRQAARGTAKRLGSGSTVLAGESKDGTPLPLPPPFRAGEARGEGPPPPAAAVVPDPARGVGAGSDWLNPQKLLDQGLAQRYWVFQPDFGYLPYEESVADPMMDYLTTGKGGKGLLLSLGRYRSTTYRRMLLEEQRIFGRQEESWDGYEGVDYDRRNEMRRIVHHLNRIIRGVRTIEGMKGQLPPFRVAVRQQERDMIADSVSDFREILRLESEMGAVQPQARRDELIYAWRGIWSGLQSRFDNLLRRTNPAWPEVTGEARAVMEMMQGAQYFQEKAYAIRMIRAVAQMEIGDLLNTLSSVPVSPAASSGSGGPPPPPDMAARQAVRAGMEEQAGPLPVFDLIGAREAGLPAAVDRQIGERGEQQDDYALVALGKPGRPSAAVALVADGLQAAGDVASLIAARRIPDELRRSGVADLLERYDAAGEDEQLRQRVEGEIRTQIERAVGVAHREIQQFRQLFDNYRKTLDPDQEGWRRRILEQADRLGVKVDFGRPKTQRAWSPGTTLALVLATRRTAFYAWVGDSRIYHHSPVRGLDLLTLDDTVAREIAAPQGAGGPVQTHLAVSKLVREGSYAGENRLTQDLGGAKPITLHQGTQPLQPGDRLLLESDGIHHAVPDEEIARPMAAAPDAAEAVRRLMQAARIGLDNRTAIVLDVEKSPVDFLAERLGTVELPEIRVAVVSAALAKQHPDLAALIGQPPIRLGDGWLLALPEQLNSSQVSELLSPIEIAAAVEGKPVRFWEYHSGERGPALDLFGRVARLFWEGNVLDQPVEEETSWKTLLARILENLKGATPTQQQLRDLEQALPSFA